MCCIIHEASHLLFKYYISKLGGGGVKTCADLADTWRGPRSGKPAGVILERNVIQFEIDHIL